MDYKIVWTDPAIEKLQGIFNYIAQDNSSAAERMVMQIIEHAEQLASPHRARSSSVTATDACASWPLGDTGFFTSRMRISARLTSCMFGMAPAPNPSCSFIPKNIAEYPESLWYADFG